MIKKNRKKSVQIKRSLKLDYEEANLFWFIDIFLYMLIILGFLFFASNIISYKKYDPKPETHLPLDLDFAYVEAVQRTRKLNKKDKTPKKTICLNIMSKKTNTIKIKS